MVNLFSIMYLTDKDLPAIKLNIHSESRNSLWKKTKLAFAYAYENYR